MDEPAGERHDDADDRLERAIVLLLLSAPAQRSWALGQLAAELDADPPTLERALDTLSRWGVVCLDRGQVRASGATWRIDELGLIGL